MINIKDVCFCASIVFQIVRHQLTRRAAQRRQHQGVCWVARGKMCKCDGANRLGFRHIHRWVIPDSAVIDVSSGCYATIAKYIAGNVASDTQDCPTGLPEGWYGKWEAVRAGVTESPFCFATHNRGRTRFGKIHFPHFPTSWNMS